MSSSTVPALDGDVIPDWHDAPGHWSEVLGRVGLGVRASGQRAGRHRHPSVHAAPAHFGLSTNTGAPSRSTQSLRKPFSSIVP